MRIKSILLSLSAIVALSAGVAHAASTNLVKNGNFEQTTKGANKQVGHGTAKTNETLLVDWSSYDGNNGGYNFVLDSAKVTTSQSAIWLKNSFTPLANGGNFFASDALYHPGVLSQSITGLTTGGLYSLTFNYALGQQVGFTGANSDNFWQVSLGTSGTKNTDALSIANGGFSGWKTATMTFKAAGATQLLSFLAEGSSPGAPPFLLLDNVSLAAVPEPSTWGMLLGGLGLMGFMARRRAAQRA